MADMPQMVLIEWVDSPQPLSGWQRLDQLEAGGAQKRVSVGFLVSEDSNSKIIASNLGRGDGDDEWDQASGVMTIPVAAITKIRFISTFQMATAKPRPLAQAEWLRRLA